MSIPTVTFVTAFIDLNEPNRSKVRTTNQYVSLFKLLASSKVPICLYVSSSYESIGIELQLEFSNVKLMPIINLEDTETYKIINSCNPSLPPIQNIEKDTKEYFILMNAKSEFVYNITLLNPFNTEHFAWIDFGIFHVISNVDNIIKNIYNLSISKIKPKLMLFPSCWSKDKSITNISLIKKQIFWRFCGGFYIGDKHSIIEMHFLIQKELPNFINYKYNQNNNNNDNNNNNNDNNNNNNDNNDNNNNNIILWEVNLWAWLEYNCNWLVDTYNANHNDTILTIPNNLIVNKSSNMNESNNNNFLSKYIDKVIYINLEHRLDRKQGIEDELSNFNIQFERFNAFSTPDFGILGCTKSHLEVIKLAKANNYKNILIFEDDFKFIVSKEDFENNINLLFDNKIAFDVCMLSYNIIKCENTNYEYLQKNLEVQTASGYIVNNSIYDKLIELYEYAIPLLDSTKKHWIYANDQIWKKLQPESNWYSFTQRIGIQRPSYSDNSKAFCDLKC